MPKHTFIDQNGNPILLSKELGKGGEGSVFEVSGNSSIAAKIYFKPLDSEKSNKILTMVSVANERLLKLAAWPIQTIYTHSKKLVGFTMPKLHEFRPLFELYSPKLRLQKFPQADWRFLIHTAMNTARAFSVVHEFGHVIGDVNHGNLLVAKDATVKFIDTDSFQISANGKNWLCEVGVATHQPPEMQGLASYKGLIRTANHDNFGLAVLIFQLLCLARHPFSGRFEGVGDMPLEKAITELRFAYSRNVHLTLMKPPPASVPIESLGPNISSLFDRAFSKEGMYKNRPNAREWVSALETLLHSLKKCLSNDTHYYLNSTVSCPWCNIEQQSGVLVFPLVTSGVKSAFCFESLWQQVIGISYPSSVPSLPEIDNISPSPSNEALEVRRNVKKLRKRIFLPLMCTFSLFFIGLILKNSIYHLLPITFISIILVYYKMSKLKIIKDIVKRLTDAKMAWNDISQNWNLKMSDAAFIKERQNLDTLKRQYDDLHKERQQDLQKLWENRRQQQLINHLDQCRIEFAKLEGIGPGRSSTLQSYGIETAADVDPQKLMCISGFGPKLIQKLVNWRKQCENKFVFNSAQGILQSDLSAIENKIMQKRFKIEKAAIHGLSQLKTLKMQIEAFRKQLQDQANIRASAYAQALINARTVGRWINNY